MIFGLLFFLTLKLNEQKQWSSPQKNVESLGVSPKFIRLFRGEGGNISWSGIDRCGFTESSAKFRGYLTCMACHPLLRTRKKRTTNISSLHWALVSSPAKWGNKDPPCSVWGSNKLVSMKCPVNRQMLYKCVIVSIAKGLEFCMVKLACTNGRKISWDIHLDFVLYCIFPPLILGR